MEYTCPHCKRLLDQKDLKIGFLVQHAFPECVHCHTPLEYKVEEEDLIIRLPRTIGFYIIISIQLIKYFLPRVAIPDELGFYSVLSLFLIGGIKGIKHLMKEEESEKHNILIIKDLDPDSVESRKKQVTWDRLQFIILAPFVLVYIYTLLPLSK